MTDRKNELLQDLQALRTQVENGLALGDSMFGRFAHAEVAHEVTQRVKELQEKKDDLERDIKEKEALIQRSNRDFTDVKDSLPETLEQKRIRFVEDYTLLFLSLAYVFMVLSALTVYVLHADQKIAAFGKGLGYSVAGTLLACTVLYHVA
jgi:hypothetical protein